MQSAGFNQQIYFFSCLQLEIPDRDRRHAHLEVYAAENDQFRFGCVQDHVLDDSPQNIARTGSSEAFTRHDDVLGPDSERHLGSR